MILFKISRSKHLINQWLFYLTRSYFIVEFGDVGVSRSILMNNWTSVTSDQHLLAAVASVGWRLVLARALCTGNPLVSKFKFLRHLKYLQS